jgi:hypothetical protein
MAAEKRSHSDELRAHAEKQALRAEQDQRREVMRRSLEHGKLGAAFHKRRQYGEAMKEFKSAIRIIEMWKRVNPGQLNASLFDKKTDMMVILMLSGVFWDLMRISDLGNTGRHLGEFLANKEKFIQFTKGTPFQTASAETLRKYVLNDKPKHKKDFRNAYTALTGKQIENKCFVATSLADITDAEMVERLREFRDVVLKDSKAGRAFVYWYYFQGPEFAGLLDKSPMIVRRLVATGLWLFSFLLALGTKFKKIGQKQSKI